MSLNPPTPASLTPCSLGAITPSGWLRRQLQIQADGLSGHLDEFWPSIARSRWIGGDSEGWERGPYWLDGIVPLAFLLDDASLKAKAARWFDHILANAHDDGWLGSKEDTHEGSGETVLDPWPLFVLFKAMIQWQEATADPRILPAMTRAAHRILTLLEEKPLQNWAAMRWFELLVGAQWLYSKTQDDRLLGLMTLARTQGYDWTAHFADFQYAEKQPHWKLENHVVNHTMALKEPALRVRQGWGGRDSALEEVRRAIETLDQHHGQATGVFSGDESLAGRSPSQGTELCAVVEYLFSLEHLVAAFGEIEFADRLERIAYNALPATFTTDMWAHQYIQQVNQAVCEIAPDGERIYTNNFEDANLFGLEPNFGCCTANMHQGWPKFVGSLWMQSPDGGLAAAAYGPCSVSFTTPDGRAVTVTEDTDYPFRDTITLTVQTDAPARFPLHLRIPNWTEGASLTVGGDAQAVPAGEWAVLDRVWHPGESVTLTLPAPIRLDRRSDHTVSVQRGPLLFGLQIGEEFRHLRGELPHADWEVLPTTPWNYGLIPDASEMAVSEAPVGDSPYSPDTPAVTITARGRRLADWGIIDHAAAPPRAFDSPGPVESVALVPYGATHLRIAEFPVVRSE